MNINNLSQPLVRMNHVDSVRLTNVRSPIRDPIHLHLPEHLSKWSIHSENCPDILQ
jgi:hypothetical protein